MKIKKAVVQFVPSSLNNIIQEIGLDLLQKGYAAAFVEFFRISHEVIKPVNNGPSYAPRQVLPADLQEQALILKTIEDEEKKKHLYTQETLLKFKQLLIQVDESNESKDATRIFEAKTNLGKLFESLDHNQDAIQMYEQALNSVQLETLSYLQIEGGLNIGKTYEKTDRLNEAIDAYETARKKCIQQGEEEKEKILAKHSIQVLLKFAKRDSNTKSQQELAINDHLNFAMKIAQESCKDGDEAMAYIYHELGKAHEQLENWEQSFQYLEQALNCAKKANNSSLKGHISASLSKCYEKSGQIDAAIQYLQSFTQAPMEETVTGVEESIQPPNVLTQKVDSSVMKNTDSASLKKTDPISLKKADSVQLKKTDSVQLKKTDSISLKKADSISLKKTDSASLKKADSISLQKADSVSLQKSDSVALQKSDSMSLKKTDSVALQKEDSMSLQKTDSQSKNESTSLSQSGSRANSNQSIAQESEPPKEEKIKVPITLTAEEKREHALSELWTRAKGTVEFRLGKQQLGNLYSKQLLYEEARKCFEEAYSIILDISKESKELSMIYNIENELRTLQVQVAITKAQSKTIVQQWIQLNNEDSIKKLLNWKLKRILSQ